MKTPERIHFETDEEYEAYCFKFDRYLRCEEWKRLNARNGLIGWLAVFITFGLICLGIYLYI